MTLKISKLQEFLISTGFIALKYFTLDDECFYVEIFHIKTCNILYLYIPSNYSFNISPEECDESVYKIKKVEIFDSESEEYIGDSDKQELDNVYGNVEINIEKSIENNYSNKIEIHDIYKKDIYELKSINRLLKRLKYSVQNIKYKLMINYKNYICSIRRDDSINIFSVKNYKKDPVKKIFVIVDLETFYSEKDKVIEDSLTVKESIIYILTKNQNSQQDNINKLLEENKNITSVYSLIRTKNEKYDKLIYQLQNMFDKIIKTEEELSNDESKDNYGNDANNIKTDILRIYNETNLNKELDKLSKLKADITKNLILLKNKKEDLIITVDKIIFDNTIMTEQIIKNYKKIKDLF
jgi:hypothetical protein